MEATIKHKVICKVGVRGKREHFVPFCWLLRAPADYYQHVHHSFYTLVSLQEITPCSIEKHTFIFNRVVTEQCDL